MDIDEKGEPGDTSPGLFWVPCPIMSPCLFCPKRTEKHADGHERETHINEIVEHVPDILVIAFRWNKKQVECYRESCAKKSVAEHINDDVGCEPRALEGRHQGSVVDLGLEKIDADEDKCEDGREGKNPAVLPSAPCDDSGHREEERIPQARFAHCAQGRTLEAEPHAHDEGEEEGYAEQGEGDGECLLLAEGVIGAKGPQQYGGDGEIGEVLPGKEHGG